MPLDFKASHTILRETRGGKRDPASDEKDRDEARWQQELYKLFQGQTARIGAAIAANPPEHKAARDELGVDFWKDEAAIFLPVIVMLATEAAQEAVAIEAALLAEQFGIVIDWTLANAEAAAWARKHAAQLVKGITKTTKRSVAETIATWIETPGSTVGELFQTLQRQYSFSESRARNIGVTEVTNAYAEGSELAYNESGIPEAVYKPTLHPN